MEPSAISQGSEPLDRERPSKLRRSQSVATAIFVILLPFLIPLLFRALGGLPSEVTIATGPEGGRYEAVAHALGREIKDRLDVRVEYRSSEGSMENLELLEQGEVELALYQPGTSERLEADRAAGTIEFVATLYRQPMFVIASARSRLDDAASLRGKTVDLGPKGSGDYAAALSLLRHLGLTEADLRPRNLGYRDAIDDLRSGELDAAIVSLGLEAPALLQLLDPATSRILEVPFMEAYAFKSHHLTSFRVPAGYLRVHPTPIPASDLATVASTAQLLSRRNVSTELVERVTEMLHDPFFLKKSRLRELLLEGTALSTYRPEYPLHRGAAHFYEPTRRPLLRPELVDATESIRSFLVSFVIAGFFLVRWKRRRDDRRKGHRIDRYIHALLAIERDQIGLDTGTGHSDIDELVELLDRVTYLRQEALGEFSAHELQEDRSVECFIEMCHALSNKINAKITRQRFDRAVASAPS